LRESRGSEFDPERKARRPGVVMPSYMSDTEGSAVVKISDKRNKCGEEAGKNETEVSNTKKRRSSAKITE
jgi:hypothetical protein